MTDRIEIHDIFVSPGHDFKGRFGKTRLNHETIRVESVDCVAGKGLAGDRYFDFKQDYKGQLSLISVEAISQVEQDLGISGVDRQDFRRNLVVSGVDLNELVGKTFSIGEVSLFGAEQCKPCFWMDEAIGEGAFAALENRGGLRCRVLSSGKLSRGAAELRIKE